MSLISVVIPACNQARFVAEAVRSALAQTHPDVEVIVVNDGSTDQTAAVLSEFATHPQVRILTQASAGLPAARNRGLSRSGGQFVCFMDADDYLERDHLERLAAPLLRDAAVGFSYCDVQQIDEHGAPAGDYSVAASRRHLSGDILDSLLAGGYFPTPAVLLRRAMLDVIGGFDAELGPHADYELWMRAAAAGWKALYVDAKLAKSRVGPGTTNRDAGNGRQTRVAALERIVRAFPARVAASLNSLQSMATELHTANRWLREQLADRVADSPRLPNSK
jgi:glycosyltransferase involved in cell wall biosynthesis